MKDKDTIGKLPDAILSKILSFLDLKSAIRTSILSKRWKPLWTFLEDFNFDFNKFWRETDPVQALYHWPQKEVVLRGYIRFVNGVLSNRDDTSRIGKFRLAFNRVNVDPVFIQSCVHYAVSHNVEELDLATYHYPKPFCFPPNFFESRSLYKLRLKYYFRESLIIPKPFCLPSLKILYLEHFEFKDDDDFCFRMEPFSCFPNLEELTLACCSVDGLIILAPKLLVLELKFRGYQPRFSSESNILKLSTPKLESFKFVGQVSLICPTEELTCLDNVYVDIYPYTESPYANDVKEKMPIKLFKFLEHLKNANTLTLSFGTIQVLSMDMDVLQRHPSPFINLKHLKFVCKHWERLGGLLSENVMAYLTGASSFSDSIIVENHDGSFNGLGCPPTIPFPVCQFEASEIRL